MATFCSLDFVPFMEIRPKMETVRPVMDIDAAYGGASMALLTLGRGAGVAEGCRARGN